MLHDSYFAVVLLFYYIENVYSVVNVTRITSTEADICSNIPMLVLQVTIYSPGYPNWMNTTHGVCKCLAFGKNIGVTANVFVLTGKYAVTPLTIAYNESERRVTWPFDDTYVRMDASSRDLILIQNATSVEIVLKTRPKEANMGILFSFILKGVSNEIHVNCSKQDVQAKSEVKDTPSWSLEKVMILGGALLGGSVLMMTITIIICIALLITRKRTRGSVVNDATYDEAFIQLRAKSVVYSSPNNEDVDKNSSSARMLSPGYSRDSMLPKYTNTNASEKDRNTPYIQMSAPTQSRDSMLPKYANATSNHVGPQHGST
ncbi:hypothetical protein ACJMK2_028776 [Sinanodonta woodiana]|uniref:Uncharacterized protein n=1 Tax=Sinanodonta woodiana TaxID=1069815 RepID=A0ABD3X869_SINWO